MELAFEIILQFLGEILLQIGIEWLVELGFHGLEDTFKRPKNPALSIFGFILWGAMAGGLSLLTFRNSLLPDNGLRTVNLFVTPVIAGGVMMLVGRARQRKGQKLVGLDRFGYAFLFAFSMAAVRFIWAT